MRSAVRDGGRVPCVYDELGAEAAGITTARYVLPFAGISAALHFNGDLDVPADGFPLNMGNVGISVTPVVGLLSAHAPGTRPPIGTAHPLGSRNLKANVKHHGY